MARPLRNVPGHYLRPNHTSWTPPSVFSFDSETTSVFDGEDEVMTLRLWCARFTDRRAPKGVIPIDDYATGEIGEDLAVQIHQWTRKRRTVWGYAHNLGFDLCTTSLIDELTFLGWTVTEFAVSSGSPFVRLHNGDRTLTLSDSWSWFAVGLDRVADALGMTKPALPKADDSKEAWTARCDADTSILHTAMMSLMDWWESENLGRWNITGSASGWNAMRHIPSPQQILIRPDDQECDHDREAIYGGRRSVWQTGGSRYGHFTEIDIEKAYTTVCRDLPLPVGRSSQFTSLPIDHAWVDCSRWGIIANVVVDTNIAVVPVRADNSVWYPVGQFHTTLAGPDIRELRAMGRLVSIGPGWLHQLGMPLRPWATWCIDSLREDNDTVPDLAKLVHKQWARSAVGKWAQRGFEILDLGPSPNQGWHYEEAWHHGKNVPAGIIDFGGNRYQVAAVNQSDNAYPAILAFVESYVRVAMGRCIAAIGDKHMVACDTDGYICDHVGADLTAAANERIAPFRVRPKRHFKRIKVTGPQHLELDQLRRRSGIPGGAEMGSDGRLHAHLWPKLSWQLANGRPGAYVRPDQAYKVASTYAPGWVLTDGTVVPVEMGIDRDGSNAITPWPQTRYARQGLTLGPDQNRRLERYAHGND